MVLSAEDDHTCKCESMVFICNAVVVVVVG